MKIPMFISTVFLSMFFYLPNSTFPQEKNLPEKQDIQEPADKQALSDLMDRMKEEADLIIETAKKLAKKIPKENVFQWAAVEIEWAMQPLFGPANAWLFQERHYKLDELAKEIRFTVASELSEDPRSRTEQFFENVLEDYIKQNRVPEGWKLERKETVTSSSLGWEPESQGATFILTPTALQYSLTLHVMPALPYHAHQTEQSVPMRACTEGMFIFGTVFESSVRTPLPGTLINYPMQEKEAAFENGIVHLRGSGTALEGPETLLSYFSLMDFIHSIPSNNWGQPQKPCAVSITIHDNGKTYKEIHPLPL